MKDLVEYIAKGLVDHPEKVEVTERVAAQAVTIRLKVAPGDMGRVIGKSGRVANAIRALLRATSVHRGKHADLRIG